MIIFSQAKSHDAIPLLGVGWMSKTDEQQLALPIFHGSCSCRLFRPLFLVSSRDPPFSRLPRACHTTFTLISYSQRPLPLSVRFSSSRHYHSQPPSPRHCGCWGRLPVVKCHWIKSPCNSSRHKEVTELVITAAILCSLVVVATALRTSSNVGEGVYCDC